MHPVQTESEDSTRQRRARVRRLERHTAASLRALSGSVSAEYKSNRVLLGAEPLRFASPYLVVDIQDAELPVVRGVADSLALRLYHSDAVLHQTLLPKAPLARIVFDILEQLRCESLAAASLGGVRSNVDEAFDAWCSGSRANGFVESELGVLLYTLIHMVRARLVRNIDNEDVAAIIEATRANIGPLIGKPFYQLPKHKQHQERYAIYATEIAETLSALVDAEAVEQQSRAAGDRRIVALPPDWEPPDDNDPDDANASQQQTSLQHAAEPLETAGGYHVFTREFDVQVTADDMYREAQLRDARRHLDKLVASQAVSVNRLALHLQRLFANPEPSEWFFGQEEGWLDARRLSQLVANPAYRQVFYQQREVPESDVVVSFLIDNSGSMKSQRFETVAVLVDTFARALELAGVRSEILGFTTTSWNGGRALQQWQAAGSTDNPGRLAESQHIVYKSADATWRASRRGIAALLKTLHYREGIDGEALIWAWQRLLARAESRRYLVMISDGSPMEAATANANGTDLLVDHLITVATQIDQRSAVHLGCIGIDLDTSHFITNSVDADLSGTLGNQSYAVLETLFRNIRH